MTNDLERDPLEIAASDLTAAEEASDEERLRVLEELYEGLETELDRDVGPTGSTGR